MVSSGKIKMSSLKKIKSLEQSLGIGHFAIKAPNGKYAVVWKNSIKTGKLKKWKIHKRSESGFLFPSWKLRKTGQES